MTTKLYGIAPSSHKWGRRYISTIWDWPKVWRVACEMAGCDLAPPILCHAGLRGYNQDGTRFSQDSKWAKNVASKIFRAIDYIVLKEDCKGFAVPPDEPNEEEYRWFVAACKNEISKQPASVENAREEMTPLHLLRDLYFLAKFLCHCGGFVDGLPEELMLRRKMRCSQCWRRATKVHAEYPFCKKHYATQSVHPHFVAWKK